MFISITVILISLIIAYIMIPPLLKKGEKKNNIRLFYFIVYRRNIKYRHWFKNKYP